MGDSVNALEWLVGQVKGVSGDGDGPLGGLLSPGEVSDLANRAAASGIALSEDDAWDLAAGVVTEWGEPERPEFRALRTDQELNLMHVAVELADRSGLKDSVWLAMAAHDRRVYASARLAEDNLEELLKWLTVRPIPPSFMSSSVTVNPILTCFDAMIENVEDGRLERATLVAMCVAADLADLPPMSLLRGSAQRTAIADWVFRRAGDVSESRAASSTLRLYANLAACRSSLREAYQKIDSGQVAISHAYEWFQNRIRHLVGLHALASDQEEYLSNVANECCYLLYIHCAQVLVGQGNPSTALDYLSRADLLPLKRMHPSNVWLGREARAAAYSSLGDVYRALEQFSGSNQGALEGHTFWAAGRIRLETGDWVGGLNWLAGGYENARINGWGGADTRMGMLLSEKFIEIGAPRLAVDIAKRESQTEDPRFATHANVVLAEAHLGLGRRDRAQEHRHLSLAENLSFQVVEEALSDTGDRLLPRAWAVLGEIHLLYAWAGSARRHLRKALDALDKEPPAATRDSPDLDSRSKYWRRPWSRNWRHVAELALLAELMADEQDAESAFTQLQRYRTLTHTGAIAELAGFTPELSLSADHLKQLEELRRDIGQLKARTSSLREEASRIDEVLEAASTERPTPESMALLERKGEIEEQLNDDLEALAGAEEDLQRVENDAYAQRAYIASAAEIRRPGLKEIRQHLAEADAAVIELVRLDGRQWGLPVTWGAFVITPKGVEDFIKLPADVIEQILGPLRGTRELLTEPMLAVLSERILSRLPKFTFGYSQLFIAADGGASMIPFRSLIKPRWWFVPWKLTDRQTYAGWFVPGVVKGWLDKLTSRLDRDVVSNVVSTTHLVRLLERDRQGSEPVGVAIGSSGGREEWGLCQGLAASLEAHPPSSAGEISWKRYPGSLEDCTPEDSDRPEWLDGESGLFVGSWHTEFTGEPTSVARFHFDDGVVMTLAEFLSKSRHKSNIAVILSCHIGRPSEGGGHGFSGMASAAFGIMEALGTTAMVATTHEVTPEVAFVLGRLLCAELAGGNDLHNSLATAQRRLREMKAAEVVEMVTALRKGVPESDTLLKEMSSGDPQCRAFPHTYDTEPFYVLGLPTARWTHAW